jgi:hypothetical protein
MKRLFQLEFHRLLKTKATWIIFTIIFAWSGLQVFLAEVSHYEDAFTGELVYFITARTIIESSFGLGSLQVLLIGVLSSLFIAQDISQGTIRNKIIAGYSKFEIYTVQMLMSLLLAFAGLFLFHLLPSIFSGLITFPILDNGTDSLENFFITVTFGYMLVGLGVLMTSFVALHAKNVATAIIFTILIFVLGPTFTSILRSIMVTLFVLDLDSFANPQAYQDVVDSINGIFDFVYFHQLNRLLGSGVIFDIFGENTRINFFNEVNYSYIWKTLLSSSILTILLFVVGGYGFARGDLK